jgi:hypothetical protein
MENNEQQLVSKQFIRDEQIEQGNHWFHHC